MRIKYGVICALIGFVLLGDAEGQGAEWKLYSQTAEALYYFDSSNVDSSDGNIIGVQVKLGFTDGGIVEMVEQFGKDYQNIDYELNDYEINCADKRFRISSVTRYSKNGKILFRVSRDRAEWTSIPPDSTSESLHKIVCK